MIARISSGSLWATLSSPLAMIDSPNYCEAYQVFVSDKYLRYGFYTLCCEHGHMRHILEYDIECGWLKIETLKDVLILTLEYLDYDWLVDDDATAKGGIDKILNREAVNEREGKKEDGCAKDAADIG